jgi:uncharacterized protein (TIGR03118 family)
MFITREVKKELNMNSKIRRYRCETLSIVGLLTATFTLLFSSLVAKALTFEQFNLVTDDNTVHHAVIQDPNLINAWGVSFNPTGPFWVSDNGTGLSTLYRVDPVTDVPTKLALTVAIPGAGNPTGQAFNNAGAGAFNGDTFLFVNEDGTVSGWRSALGTTAETLVPGSSDNLYKGTTFATIEGHGYLYAADFHGGTIDVLKGDSGAPDLAGAFTDPTMASGYAPFNVRNLGDTLYVTYAKQSGGADEVAGPGFGFVDAFDLQGNFLSRVGSQGTLNAPWGLEIAPASFGSFAGDLLVGNFGDGTINIFDLDIDNFVGQLQAPNGGVLSIDGLWALIVGNNGSAGSSDKLYFTAGPDGESHGLFGMVRSVPDAASTQLGMLFVLAIFEVARRCANRRDGVAEAINS